MDRVCVAVIAGVTLAAFLATLAPVPAEAIECPKNKSHNVFMGNKQYGDQLLYMDSVKKEGKIWGYVSADLDSGNLQKRISYIEVIDGYNNSRGGCAYLTTGGVGNYRAAFHLKATENRGGLDFTLKVFGH